MNNQATIKHGVLSQSLLDKLHAFSRDGRQPSRTNLFGWDPTVVGVSNPIFFFFLEDDLKEELVKELLDKEVLPKKPKQMSASIALYSRGAFIPWHNDNQHKFSATLYLNKVWDSNWGGYLAYQEEAPEIKCLIPNYNTCICYHTPLMHSVQLTAINAPMRESLQVFVDEFEE